MTLPDWMKGTDPGACPAADGPGPVSFVDKSLLNFASFLRKAFILRRTGDGPLQRLEPRARLAGFLLLMLGAALFEGWLFISALLVLTVCLSVLTKAGVYLLLLRALPAVAFTAALSVPAVFSFVTPGTPLIDAGWATITAEGVRTALFFVLRVSTMALIASLAVLTAAEGDFFKGLSRLLPGFFATALFFTFKYALILVKTAEEAALARKSRTMGGRGLREAQRWFASRAAFILKKSLNTAEEVGMAFVSRGFNGRFAASGAGPLKAGEYIWLAAASFVFFLSFGF